jgi:CMP-N,N'-diacetyllegionaminic acid synthase
MRQRTLALITARGGSKGLPGKNTRLLAGRPLIAWTVDAALQASGIQARDVICSTDSRDIADAALAAGARVPFLRPAALATDDASSLSAALHAIDWLETHEGLTYDTLLLLQPTSPLRTHTHIDEAMALLAAAPADAVVGVYRAHASPFRMFVPRTDGLLQPLLPVEERPHQRQLFPDVLTENGAIYLTRIAALRSTGSFHGGRCLPYVMSARDSLDIDSAADFADAAAHLTRMAA